MGGLSCLGLGFFEIERDCEFKSECLHISGHLLLYIDTSNLLDLNDLACAGGENWVQSETFSSLKIVLRVWCMDNKYMGNTSHLCFAGNSNLTGIRLTLCLWFYWFKGAGRQGKCWVLKDNAFFFFLTILSDSGMWAEEILPFLELFKKKPNCNICI